MISAGQDLFEAVEDTRSCVRKPASTTPTPQVLANAPTAAHAGPHQPGQPGQIPVAAWIPRWRSAPAGHGPRQPPPLPCRKFLLSVHPPGIFTVRGVSCGVRFRVWALAIANRRVRMYLRSRRRAEQRRDELAGALGVDTGHAAVRVKRMEDRLDAARLAARALRAGTCPELTEPPLRCTARPVQPGQRMPGSQAAELTRQSRFRRAQRQGRRRITPRRKMPVNTDAYPAGSFQTGASGRG